MTSIEYQLKILQAFQDGREIKWEHKSKPYFGKLNKDDTPHHLFNFFGFSYEIIPHHLPAFDPSLCPKWWAGYAMSKDGIWSAYRIKQALG